MASDSVKKVQEILFRGGVPSPSPPTYRPDFTADNNQRLTIQIPTSTAPATQKAPPKSLKTLGSDSLNSKVRSYRAALREKLGDAYVGAERHRLDEDRDKLKHWKRWGPYVSDRQWVSPPSSQTSLKKS